MIIQNVNTNCWLRNTQKSLPHLKKCVQNRNEQINAIMCKMYGWMWRQKHRAYDLWMESETQSRHLPHVKHLIIGPLR